MDAVANSANNEPKPVIARKPYCKPEIIHELELETRAGSPITPGSYLLFGDILENKDTD